LKPGDSQPESSTSKNSPPRPTIAVQKMRPGQPPSRIVWRISCYPFPRTRHGRCTGHRRSHEQRRNLVLGRPPSRSVLHESISSTARWPTASPAVCGDSVRRPQRPGQPAHVETRSGGTLPVIHPRELPGTAGSAQCSGRARRTSRLNVRHCAPRLAGQQGKSRVPLCRNCEWLRFLVESAGKEGILETRPRRLRPRDPRSVERRASGPASVLRARSRCACEQGRITRPSTTSVAANPLPGSNHARILPINLSCFRGKSCHCRKERTRARSLEPQPAPGSPIREICGWPAACDRGGYSPHEHARHANTGHGLRRALKNLRCSRKSAASPAPHP